MFSKAVVFILIVAIYFISADDEFRFANHYGDHMVLQREPHQSILWGFGAQGARVEVRLINSAGKLETIYETVAYEDGRGQNVWKIILNPYKAGGPYTIVASSVSENTLKEVILDDILFGDVWLCTGQSNMAFTVGMSFSADHEISIAPSYPNVRLFTLERTSSNVTIPEVLQSDILQNWVLPSAESVGGPDWQYFSALCWMYGRRLYEQYGIPIGLVSTNYGATNIESWSSEEQLRSCIDTEYMTDHSVHYNSMIYPLLNMTIYGIIWYQGEGNALLEDDIYNCTFPAMINGWRKDWYEGTYGNTDRIFPFGFVQLATMYPTELFLPITRWKQTANYGFVPNEKMPNTFMAIALDLPDDDAPYGSIHPRDKTDVAIRMVLGARNIAYNENDVYWTGPIIERIDIKNINNSILEITVYYNKSSVPLFGIDVRSKNGFEIQLNYSTNWTRVLISSFGKDHVQIDLMKTNSSEYVTGVRYNWDVQPCSFKLCAIYGSDLPSPPFIFYGPFGDLNEKLNQSNKK